MMVASSAKFRRLLVAVVVGCVFASGAGAESPAKPARAAAQAAVTPKPGSYRIDLDHTHALFAISHLGISRFFGRFDNIQGEFSVGNRPDASSVKASIRVDSIDTKHQKLEEHLKSPDFFDAARFPTMDFVSTKVSWNPRGEGKLAGNLTIHGVTKPVEFALRLTGAGLGPRGEVRAGFEATTSIKRSDFGMSYGLPNVVGDLVEITLSAEGVLQ